MANQDMLDTNLAVSNAHIFSGSMLNEVRFSLVRRDLDFPENDPESPTADITGSFQIGGGQQFSAGALTNAYQFSDTLTWNAGRHALKFGADIRYNDVDNRVGVQLEGHLHLQQPAGLHQQQRIPACSRHFRRSSLRRQAVADVFLRAGRLPR